MYERAVLVNLALSRLTFYPQKHFSAGLQSDGVTVAQEILVFLVQVRILVGLQIILDPDSGRYSYKQENPDLRGSFV